MRYLAIDPGHSTGWAVFLTNGDLNKMGTCKSREEVYELLDQVDPNLIICEDWITIPGVPLGGDNMETARVIGAIEHWAYRKGNVRVVLQPNTIKAIGYTWAGIKKTKTKAASHEQDAYVHGVYFLQKTGVRRLQQGRR